MVNDQANAADLKFNTQEFAPFNYSENKKVGGPAADIIRRICTDIKASCTMTSLPWRRAQDEVKSGKANALFVIGWNQERANWLHFSPPILNTEYGFFINTQAMSGVGKVEDFDGKKIGTFGPSNTSRSLDKLSESLLRNIRIDMTPDDVAAFKKLGSNRLDAVYSNREAGRAIIRNHKIENMDYAVTHKKLKYYIGFSKQYTNEALVNQFNEQFIKLHQQGVIQNILDPYKMEASELD